MSYELFYNANGWGIDYYVGRYKVETDCYFETQSQALISAERAITKYYGE